MKKKIIFDCDINGTIHKDVIFLYKNETSELIIYDKEGKIKLFYFPMVKITGINNYHILFSGYLREENKDVFSHAWFFYSKLKRTLK